MPAPAAPPHTPHRAAFGIGRRLLLTFGASAVAALSLAVWAGFHLTRNELLRLAEARTLDEVRDSARQLDDVVAGMVAIPRSVAALQESQHAIPHPGMAAFLRSLLAETPDLYGVSIAYESLDWKMPGSSLYFCRKDWPAPTPINYDFQKRPWFAEPKATRRTTYTEPYFYAGSGDVGMVSVTVPVESPDGSLIAVAGADLTLHAVHDLVTSTSMSFHGTTGGVQSAYLVSESGKIIVHPDHTLVLRQGFEGADISTLPDGEAVASSPQGLAHFRRGGDQFLTCWATAPMTGWKMVLNVPEKAILAPVMRVVWTTVTAGVAGILLVLAAAFLVSRQISRPITELGEAASALEQGRLDPARLDPLAIRRDEIGRLARDFQSMAHRILAREHELADLNHSLETTVCQRTAQLETAVAEAEAARDEATLANQAKSTFLANMSHELRTPLNAIVGYAEMLAEEASPDRPQDKADLEKILSSARHLLELINGVLDLSKIEAGKMTVQSESFDASAVVREVESMAAPLARRNANSLTISLPAEPLPMRSDRAKIKQSLLNLVSNACKFTHDGAVTIEVSLADSETIRFQIIDTGIGLAPDQLARIFEPFTQADDSTTRKFGGTGLGLAISQRFARLLGGDITASSSPGKGSIFTLLLPRTPTASNPPRSLAPPLQ